MIDFKQAVSSAKSHICSLEVGLEHLMVEELSLSEDGKTWLVTLGYDAPSTVREYSSMLGMPSGRAQAFPRVYRYFEVDAETGQVRRMKMRSGSDG